jgi:hypothetical protein
VLFCTAVWIFLKLRIVVAFCNNNRIPAGVLVLRQVCFSKLYWNNETGWYRLYFLYHTSLLLNTCNYVYNTLVFYTHI